MIDEQLSKLLGSIPPIFYNESDNMEYSGSGRYKLPKRGKRIPHGAKCINGCCESTFCAYPRTSPQQNVITKILGNAYGENGINGGVAILKRKITIFPQNDAKLCKEE